MFFGIMCHSDLLCFIFICAFSFCPQQKESWWRVLWILHSRRTRRKRARWEVAGMIVRLQLSGVRGCRPQLRHEVKLHAVPPSVTQAGLTFQYSLSQQVSRCSIDTSVDVAGENFTVCVGSAWDYIMLCYVHCSSSKINQVRPTHGICVHLS